MSAAKRLAGRLSEGAGRVYGALPQPLVDVLGLAHPLVALAGGLRPPVSIARGRCAATGERAAVLAAGGGADVDYLLQRFFDGPVETEARGRVPLPRLPGHLMRLRGDCDLTIARMDRLAARALLGSEYLRLPDWLGTLLPVPRDLESHTRLLRSVSSDVQRVRQNDLDWCVSRSPGDFEHFYHRMYLPFARRRHGALVVPRSIHQMRRVFRAGCLLWVTHRGQRVSAILLMPIGNVLKFVVLGTIDGSPEPVKLGGLSALYLFSLRYAAERGLAAVDFGGVRPCLSDGVLRYKRKWGVRLQPKPDVYHDFLVYWPRSSTTVTSFLRAQPLVCRRGREFVGLTALGAGGSTNSPSRIRRQLWTEGLERLYVLGDEGDAAEARDPSYLTIVGADSGSAAVSRAIHCA